ncbi:glycosyltransferase family 4 protein [Gemmatirosa kalamazoonensis]|uniref:glycosyltransferase family 4 protein n=1 Tax=Gemmatirosa kalamazoonensis TaxID=861299 RepID=UPI00191C410B|nr:glycosyltransferase family 4 protein [Gemmatirosa kalamazoonensis]
MSVPLEGWNHWEALSRRTDAHLVTQIRNREQILRKGVPERRLTTIDTRPVERMMDRAAALLRPGGQGGLTTLTAFSAVPYYAFERALWREFGPRIQAGEFDLVHRLTPLSPTTPSVLAAKCARAGVPFVLGPLNGGLPWPPGFDHARLKEREWLTYVRDAYKLLPGYRGTRRHAAAIICGSMATRAQIAPAYQDKTVYIPENAIDPARFDVTVSGEVELPLRVAFVGRFTIYKGCDMLIEAAAPLVRAGKLTLDLIGDGPQAPELRALAAREGVPESSFAGWVKHTELKQRLSQSHVFAFPSIREFGGAVVLEAMALGLVPIVVNYGGPGELVSERTGYALPIGRRAEIVARLRATLDELVADPERIRPMGRRARERVFHHFTWDAKATQTVEVYRWVLGQREKPDFGMPLPDPD